MKLIISSSELLKGLMAVAKAIPAKSPLPILENFLFDLKASTLDDICLQHHFVRCLKEKTVCLLVYAEEQPYRYHSFLIFHDSCVVIKGKQDMGFFVSRIISFLHKTSEYPSHYQ